MIKDWSKYPNFSKAEFDCSETYENDMQPEFLLALQNLRNKYGKPITITSGFRSVNHSDEIRKIKGGTHTMGIAADISVYGENKHELLRLAMKAGVFNGIGVAPWGIHLDISKERKAVWSY